MKEYKIKNVGLSNERTSMNKKLFYYGGYGAGIFYLIGDVVGGVITPNYSYIKNAVSELIQSGAENRLFLSSLLVPLLRLAKG